MSIDVKHGIKNIFLSIISSGSKNTSVIFNMTIISDNNKDKNIYTELNQEYAKYSTDDFCNEIITNHMYFNDTESIKYFNSENNTIFIKDQNNIVFKEVEKYLLDLTENGKYYLQFWVDNPVDWMLFINNFFPYKNEVPIIPEYINPFPNDLNTLFQFILNKNNDEKYKTIQDTFPLPDKFMYSSLLKAKYNEELYNMILNYTNSN